MIEVLHSYKARFCVYLKITSVLLLTILAVFSSCKKSEFETPDSVSIYEIAKEDATNFSYLSAAIDRAGLKEELNGSGNFTLFAPNNQAFIDAGYTDIASIKGADPEQLKTLLNNHLLEKKIDIKAVSDESVFTSLSGQELLIKKNTFISADSANIKFFVNGIDVINTNFNATNGNVQVINSLLVPAKGTIYSILNSNPNLSFFTATINRASQSSVNYKALLSGTGSYTVFAVPNVAFTNFNGGVYNSLDKINSSDPEALSAILSYLIIPQKIFAYQFTTLNPKSLNNKNLIFSAIAKTGRYNRVEYTANGNLFTGYNANQLATNGVINNVRNILVSPSELNNLQEIKNNPNLTFFAAAITKASTGSTNFETLLSRTDSTYTVFAPTDAAFQVSNYNSVADVSAESPDVLTAILKNHIIKNRFYSTNIQVNQNFNVKSIGGLACSLTITGGYQISGTGNSTPIPVSSADLITQNGVLNVIGGVLK
nr:fasciclin domain-containing protein [uncultured Pedobacter sp.]